LIFAAFEVIAEGSQAVPLQLQWSCKKGLQEWHMSSYLMQEAVKQTLLDHHSAPHTNSPPSQH